MVTWFFDLISGQMRRAESKHATISDALKINGILPPLQFPPPGIKRDFRGIHRQSVPNQDQDQDQKRLCPPTSRLRRGAGSTPRGYSPQTLGRAVPCTQSRYSSQIVAVELAAAATPPRRPAGHESSPGRGGSGSGLSAGGYAAGGLFRAFQDAG